MFLVDKKPLLNKKLIWLNFAVLVHKLILIMWTIIYYINQAMGRLYWDTINFWLWNPLNHIQKDTAQKSKKQDKLLNACVEG